MKILITGGAGFIGSNLICHIVQTTDHSILNLDVLTYAGNLNSLRDVEASPRYQFSKIDICALRMLQAARAHYETLKGETKENFRFLHASTDEVYGSLGETGLFSEATPDDPHSPYSASKASSDHLVRAWANTYGLPVLVTNCSNNYAPFQFPEKPIPIVILKALRDEAIPIYGKGTNTRGWLYVGDHVNALDTVVSTGKVGETYNIGGDNERKNIDTIRLRCSLLDKLRPRVDGNSYREQIIFVADRPGHDLRYATDASKIKEELGWSPKQDNISGFKKTTNSI